MEHTGYFSLTSRKNDSRRKVDLRWYCRLSIPPEAAAAACFAQGVKVNVSRDGENVVLRRDDETGRVTIPAPARRDGRLTVETSGVLLDLTGHHVHHCPVAVLAEPGVVTFVLPSAEAARMDYHARERAKRVVVQHGEVEPLRPADWKTLGDAFGTAQVLSIEAARTRIPVRAMTVEGIVERLRGEGHSVHAYGPRFFSLDGSNISAAELLEFAYDKASQRGERIAMLATG